MKFTIRLRQVTLDDAAFILGLRTDVKYNRYLSPVESNLKKQREWIAAYKEDEAEGTQFYFVIERLDGTACGTVRLYDFRGDSFAWGSWILNEDKTRFAAVESALLVYERGFGELGFCKSHFEVNKNNTKVVSFHRRFGAQVVNEDAKNVYFELMKKTYTEEYLPQLIGLLR